MVNVDENFEEVPGFEVLNATCSLLCLILLNSKMFGLSYCRPMSSVLGCLLAVRARVGGNVNPTPPPTPALREKGEREGENVSLGNRKHQNYKRRRK